MQSSPLDRLTAIPAVAPLVATGWRFRSFGWLRLRSNRLKRAKPRAIKRMGEARRPAGSTKGGRGDPEKNLEVTGSRAAALQFCYLLLLVFWNRGMICYGNILLGTGFHPPETMYNRRFSPMVAGPR